MPKPTTVLDLAAAQQQLVVLRNEARQLARPEAFSEALGQLEVRLADLEVAYEELEQQNEELAATREALERERHRYRHLFEEAPFGYLVTDVHGIIEEANRAVAGLFGLRQDRLTGKPFSVYIATEDQQIFRDLLARVRADEPAVEMELRIRSRRGRPVPVMLTAVRDLDSQKRAARLRWTLRDVSSTKAAEEALRVSEERLRHSQRMEAVGRLAGGIAHSFNNLLAAISFQCELLTESIPAEDVRLANVEEIQHAGERAASLARQLLAYGRKQTLQPRVLSLNEVLREMAPMLRRLIGEHIRLEIELDPADGAVHVDLGQLEQVILNLAVNARDALRSGGILRLAVESLTLAAGEIPELPAGGYVRLTVADTGPGMPSEVMEHLFEPFFTTKARGEGTGLGLATVHGIVHQSGGQIRVESSPGEGTRFTILLPRTAEGSEASPVRPSLPGRRSRRRLRGRAAGRGRGQHPRARHRDPGEPGLQGDRRPGRHPGPRDVRRAHRPHPHPGHRRGDAGALRQRARPPAPAPPVGSAGALHLGLPGRLDRPPRRPQRGPALPPEALPPGPVPGEDPRCAGWAGGGGGAGSVGTRDAVNLSRYGVSPRRSRT